ncbi:SCO family protein [Cohnella silvisoli]|uniref:SCO family protein n=1 Tax=Cohnella silvisoli TaxID=2873699 RepID=A0ABV1L292_9BACL|nr:SCO family protein [Cohnella silvisoli]MCD9025355.1 SCO family protein [Cohnella silvisoli]
MPSHDTSAVLREYAKRMNMDMAGWDVLRGQAESTKQIASQYGIMVQNTGEGQFVHTVTSLQLIDSNQRIRKVYEMGEDLNVDEVLKDIQTLVDQEDL